MWQIWMEEALQAQGFDPMSGQKAQSPPPNSDCWIDLPNQGPPLCYQSDLSNKTGGFKDM